MNLTLTVIKDKEIRNVLHYGNELEAMKNLAYCYKQTSKNNRNYGITRVKSWVAQCSGGDHTRFRIEFDNGYIYDYDFNFTI